MLAIFFANFFNVQKLLFYRFIICIDLFILGSNLEIEISVPSCCQIDLKGQWAQIYGTWYTPPIGMSYISLDRPFYVEQYLL